MNEFDYISPTGMPSSEGESLLLLPETEDNEDGDLKIDLVYKKDDAAIVIKRDL